MSVSPMTGERPSAVVRRFELEREVDETGISGTGIVATGVLWPDGRVALRWMTEHRSSSFYDSMADVEAIHGHGGKTRIRFVDEDGEHEWLCYRCAGGLCKGYCPDCGASGTTVLVPRWFGKATLDEIKARYAHARQGANAEIERLKSALKLARNDVGCINEHAIRRAADVLDRALSEAT